ncbi:MAG TPA: carbohydrate binding domain-containing protein, partial [Steroidobacteraceae bacterium]
MALDFPASPSNGQTYVGPGGAVWQWDGAKWINGASGVAYAPIASPVLTGDPQAPTPVATDADTSIATTAFVSAAVGAALHNVGRNLIHNPLFNVAQRGVGPWTTAGVWTLDRWFIYPIGSAQSVTQQIVTDADRAAIGDEAARYWLNSVATGTAGASDQVIIRQTMEDVRRTSGKTVTISFYAKASAGTPKLGLALSQNFGTGGSPSPVLAGIGGQSVTLSTAWARYSVTITVPSASGKILGSTVGTDCLSLDFCQSAGVTSGAALGTPGVQSYTLAL